MFNKSKFYFCLPSLRVVAGKDILETEWNNSDFIETFAITDDNIHNAIDIDDKLCNLCDSGEISEDIYDHITKDQEHIDLVESEVVQLYPIYLKKYPEIKWECELYNCDAIYMEAISNVFKNINR